MKADDFRSLSKDELDVRLSDLRKELFNLRMQLFTNQLQDSNRIKKTKQDIARALTVRKEILAEAE